MTVASAAQTPVIKTMWAVSGCAEEAVLPGVVAPDSHIEFVFHLGDPWRMRREGASSWIEQPRAFVCAQSHRALRFDGSGFVSVVAVRLNPVVATSVLGRPATDLWNVPVALRDLLGRQADALVEQLAATPAHERFAVLQKWIVRRLSNWCSSDWKAQRLFDHVMWHAPSKNMETLSKQLGWSTRALRRSFARYTGLSPKEVQLAGRHLDACALLREQPGLQITEIAGRIGFCDHAAFTHSFERQLGMTPSRFRMENHAFFERRP